MRCDQFQTRLNDRLDERVSPHEDSALTAHALQCADCRQTMQAWQAIESHWPTTDAAPLAAEFAPRVVRAARRGRRPSIRWAGALVALAALLLVAVVPALRRAGMHYLTGRAPATHAPLDRPWVRQTGQQLASVMLMKIPGFGLATLSGPVDPFDSNPRQWVDRFEDRLRRISPLVDKARESFRGSEPASAEESKS